MLTILQGTADLAYILSFMIAGTIVAFAWAPLLSKILFKFHIIKGPKIELRSLGSHNYKANTPVMGGLLVIITVALITILFNWSRSFTWVPIGVMLTSAALGAVDDLMNIYGRERRSRKLKHVWTLIRVHKDISMRIWYVITMPWTIFKRLSVWFGSRPGKGIFVHEKLILQFIAGAFTAWWIYAKLGPAWHYIYFPFDFSVNASVFIIPIIIFIVMFTANAVNIADGMDGLAGGSLIITFSALSILSWINGFGELAILNATTVGALVTYTYFNIKPARFMMGDVGSLGLGALLAVNAMAIGETSALVFLGFIFYIEAISVVLQVFSKYIFGRKIFRMAPLHHHFELKGWSEEKTVMRFWVLHFIFVVFGFWLALHRSMDYLHWDQKTITDFSEASIAKMYDNGYVFTRLGKGVMHQTRSARIDLKRFELSSENRRIIRKTESVSLKAQKLPLTDYDYRIGKLAKDFYDNKFGAGIMSAQKIKEILTDHSKSNFNLLLEYSSDDQTIGFAICFANALSLHYSYPFYDLSKSPKDMGMGMMIRAILHAREAGLRYVYLGSIQRPGDVYKLQFEGLEWFDGKVWRTDIDPAKEILKSDK